MKLDLTADERAKLIAYMETSGDCEKLNENEWVMDIYDTEVPISLDLVFIKESVYADGAEYLMYDEVLDGWYISAPIESAEKAVSLLRIAGVLSDE